MAFLGKIGPMDSDASDKNWFFSSFHFYRFEVVRRELKGKNKPCRYLEFWVCLLSCVNIQRIFLKSLDSPVSDAECINVLFSTNSPNKSECFWLKLQWKNHSRSYWKVCFGNLIFIKIHNTSPDISDYQDSDAETKTDILRLERFAASWHFQSSLWWNAPST